eukprot:CAMPEP_0185591212 /NCGR_PEP_ID=MMETSP0434-20130131/63782_1 /TAXON_ID=626734 ORGANISM="Favella taraikaensis, Strain Fe Narragansett Bay" /NCGR_SAMPLE_ID=MMETSP0434 /ASSEMBLY_ACC=CAM_ASM_000379 /LENGTH=61 /DNA_ID=CAMNT_0028216045 /DNA_START=979 /DNA_END=1167 /DNA_ORIENTATION=-
MPKAFVASGYQIHMSLMLAFLDKLDAKLKGDTRKKAYFNASNEKARIQSMASEWLNYERVL